MSRATKTSTKKRAEKRAVSMLVRALTDLIAMVGTRQVRETYPEMYAECIEAMAIGVASGCTEPITLAHADEVYERAEAVKL